MGTAPAGSTSEHRSICRLCAATCGIVVTVEDGQITRVRGDEDHPVSRGYVCGKGRSLAPNYNSSRRLDFPTMRGERVTWPTVLDDLGGTLAALLREHGPDSVGYYSASGQYPDKAGLFAEQRLFAQIGSRSRYTAASVDNYPALKAAELVTGYPGTLIPVWDPEHSPPFVLLVGQNPVVSHGYLSFLTDPIRRIRQFRENGGRMCVLDPRRTETAALADLHLQPRPGTDGAILAWLVRELLEAAPDTAELRDFTRAEDVETLRVAVAPFTLSVVSDLAGIDAEVLVGLFDEIRRSGRIACLIGTGVTFGPHAVVTAWLSWVLLIVTGSLDRPDGMRFNRGLLAPLDERVDWSPSPPGGRVVAGPASRPELPSFIGEFPVAAMVDEIEAGNLRALIVAGGNPITALPEPDRVVAALRRLDAIAVIDVFSNEVTDLATHVLAGVHQLERADLALRDHACYTAAAVPVGADRRPVWWIHAQLAQRLGYDILNGLDPDSAVDDDVLRLIVGGSARGVGSGATGVSPDAAPNDGDEVFDRLVRGGPHGEMAERRFGWVRRVLPDGRWRLTPPVVIERLPELLHRREPASFSLVSRRVARHVNSARYVPSELDDKDMPELQMHPLDAEALEVADGARVRVGTKDGALEAAVKVDKRLRQGVVSLTHGWQSPNPNQLVNRFDVDELTGQPQLSAIELSISPATSPEAPRPPVDHE